MEKQNLKISQVVQVRDSPQTKGQKKDDLLFLQLIFSIWYKWVMVDFIRISLANYKKKYIL